MKNPSLFLSAFTLAASLSGLLAADITGTVTFKGATPAETPIPLDPVCGKMHTGGLTTGHYVVGPKGEFANVVVSLKGISGKSGGASAAPAMVDQKGCLYSPHISAIQTGQKLLVKNSDALLHNVHPTPAPGTDNKEVNKAQLPNGPDITFTFPAAENFLRFKCDVHPWMFAYVSVFDHPYFSVSSKEGTFKIANVPPGKYTVEAAHRKGGIVTKEIEVKADTVKLDFVIEAK